MGRHDEEPEDDDLDEEEEDEEDMDFDEDYDDDLDADTEKGGRTSQHPGGRKAGARQLIEKVREQRELSRSLADFDDYLN